MTRLLVTGGAGFIGSRVVRAALDRGWQVGVLRVPGDDMPRLRDLAGRFDVLEGRLGDAATREAAAAWRPERCIHLAWHVDPADYLTSPQNIPCLVDSLALLETLIDAGCEGAVFVGTCAEYDTSVGWLSEEAPTRPETLYAASKLALGQVAMQRAARTALALSWARLFYLFGPGEDPRRLVPAAVRSLESGTPFAASTGEQVRDYLHVDDVASALLVLADAKARGVYNVASGIPVTVRGLLETLADLVGRPDLLRLGALPARPWDPAFICGDVRQLRDLGWSPARDLRAGLAATIAAMRAGAEPAAVEG